MIRRSIAESGSDIRRVRADQLRDLASVSDDRIQSCSALKTVHANNAANARAYKDAPRQFVLAKIANYGSISLKSDLQ